ncbi:hypothetical protein COCCU_05130 [Corynebacterium occultum]|uniref:Uncharacterized protein n=1 Tax=Corynebacterium occultum TaxID=2675219 RepID=A0A6B8VN80_9CORY|nr:hypothetical protein [Corynebacterium occultum]QGU06972.1 hypothetical protein COCCU_05130 [Corynebacterium occultum]
MTDPKNNQNKPEDQDENLDNPSTDEEKVREQEAESFPASDAPGNY